MDIREARTSDAAAIRQLVFEVLGEYGLQADPGNTDRDLDNLQHYYGDGRGYFAVAEENGKIIASVAILKVDIDTCELRKMYVLGDYRGLGLGRALLEHVIARAEHVGFSKMILETASVLKEAIALYRKYGFIEYQPEHLSARCDQAFYLNLHPHKKKRSR